MYIKDIDRVLSHYLNFANVPVTKVPTKKIEYKNLITSTYEGFQQSFKQLTDVKFPICYEEEVLNRIKQVFKWRQELSTLLKYPLIQQKTPEWYALRQDKITASEFGQALGYGKYGKPIDTVLNKAYDIPQDFYQPATHWGNKHEDTAIKIYEHLYHTRVYEFGMFPNNVHKFFGASPDGINDLGIMVEIKCPFKRKLQKIPVILEQYYYQIQGQLHTCNLENCDYFECYIMEYTDRTKFFKELQTQSMYSKGDYVANQVFFGIIVQKHFDKNTQSVEDFTLDELYHKRSPVNLQYEELLKWETENINYDESYYNEEQLLQNTEDEIQHQPMTNDDNDMELLSKMFKRNAKNNNQQNSSPKKQKLEYSENKNIPQKKEFKNKIIFWKCYKYHLENVPYNKKFFEQKISQLEEVWNQIQTYKQYHKTHNDYHPEHKDIVLKMLQKKQAKQEKEILQQAIDVEMKE